MNVARWLHLLGVTIWVGGMFFAHMALRPGVAALAPPVRLALLAGVLARFFLWVNVAIGAILASGLFLLLRAGGKPHWSVHAMTGIGVVMMLIYLHIYFSPFRRLRAAVVAQDWPAGGAAMGTIRKLVATNLVLGLAVITVAALGRGFA